MGWEEVKFNTLEYSQWLFLSLVPKDHMMSSLPPVIRTAAALPLYTSDFTKSMVVLLGGRGGLFGVFGGI